MYFLYVAYGFLWMLTGAPMLSVSVIKFTEVNDQCLSVS